MGHQFEEKQTEVDRLADGLGKIGLKEQQGLAEAGRAVILKELKPHPSKAGGYAIKLESIPEIPGARHGTRLYRAEAEKLEDEGGFKRWTAEQDRLLRAAVQRYDGKNWKLIAEAVPGRTHVQCLQRWKKVLRPGLVKGHWTKEEDAILKKLMENPANVGNWAYLAEKIPGRTAKQCRERWCLNLNPNINHGPWTEAEDQRLLQLQGMLGNRWAEIASRLDRRTENAVKTRYKSLMRAQEKLWTVEEDATIIECKITYRNRWISIAKILKGRSKNAIKLRWKVLAEIDPSLEMESSEPTPIDPFVAPSSWSLQKAQKIQAKLGKPKQRRGRSPKRETVTYVPNGRNVPQRNASWGGKVKQNNINQQMSLVKAEYDGRFNPTSNLTQPSYLPSSSSAENKDNNLLKQDSIGSWQMQDNMRLAAVKEEYRFNQRDQTATGSSYANKMDIYPNNINQNVGNNYTSRNYRAPNGVYNNQTQENDYQTAIGRLDSLNSAMHFTASGLANSSSSGKFDPGSAMSLSNSKMQGQGSMNLQVSGANSLLDPDSYGTLAGLRDDIFSGLSWKSKEGSGNSLKSVDSSFTRQLFDDQAGANKENPINLGKKYYNVERYAELHKDDLDFV